MARALFFILLFSIVCSAFAEAPVVAVFQIQDMRVSEARLSKKKIRALTDLFRNFLAEGGAFKVVPHTGIR